MAGTYTDITEVTAPSTVDIGQTVNVIVKAKNTHSAQLHMYIVGVVVDFNGATTRFINWVGANVNPGAIMSAGGSFVPVGSAGTLTINIYTYYDGADGYTHLDDSESKSVEVVGVTPPTMPSILLNQPTANPLSGPPGSVSITCPVVVSSTQSAVLFQIKCIVFEGSILPSAGDTLDEQTQTLSLADGIHNIQFNHVSTYRSQERRDIGVEVYYNGEKIADGQWDDIFHVVGLETKRLEIDITPIGRGYVVTDKASNEGRTQWSNNDAGFFPKGSVIQVTAFPYEGYEFEKWSDQIEGGISYQNPANTKPLDNDMAVKLHLIAVGGGGGAGAIFNSLSIDGWGDNPTALGTTPVDIIAGGSLYVKFTLEYDAVQAGQVELWISLVVDPFRDRTWKFLVPLEVGTNMTATDTLAIPISSTESTLDNKTYDLWCEINNVIDDKAIGAVAISGMPKGTLESIGDFSSMIGMMIVMMMLTMMMEQTRELYEPTGTPQRPKPVSEAFAKGVRKAGEYGGKVIKKVTEYYEGEEGE